MDWLENEQRQQYERREVNVMVNDDEILINSERATEKIMEVFDDPIFQQSNRTMELEEIDF